MNEPGLVEQAQAVQELLGENADQRGAQASELILLNEFIEIDAE